MGCAELEQADVVVEDCACDGGVLRQRVYEESVSQSHVHGVEKEEQEGGEGDGPTSSDEGESSASVNDAGCLGEDVGRGSVTDLLVDTPESV